MLSDLTDTELCRLFESHGFITGSTAMLPILRQARKAATVSDITVLLEGETGTGKQVLAQAIHNLDEKRKSFPFITVHCSTVTEALAESELFGHQRGAFSGATRDREGLFRAAHRGTLFLDDVNDLPLALQPKLLDVLQRGMIRGVGSDHEGNINVRIIAAANQPLAPAVRENRFRGDLYHRLNVVRLPLPPLRERSDDLPSLVLAFAARHRNIYPYITRIDGDLVEFLKSCTFHGNVRELEHAVERMLFAKTAGESLQLSDWTQQCCEASPAEEGHDLVSQAAQRLWTAIFQHGVPYSEAIRRLERRLLENAVRGCGQTRREIACRLHTSERTLYHKLRSHNLTGQAVAD
ncbi:MAG TPA: sigma 54-interacting transcriptional regulator [Bryobacteraceae bacterium]|nr:sigma 54-interacting transcriptional regulator [Bryobacteraceae bacterium]